MLRALVVAVLAGAAGAFALGVGGWALVRPLAAEVTLLQPAPAAGAGRRCAACGWIESRRELEGADQYTVRMRDGSSRVFEETSGTRWRLGERLIFID